MEKDQIYQKALEYHASHPAGKLAVAVTKSTNNQEDLALAYSPGVAAPVKEIADDPSKAYDYTNKGNLVAVVSNGSAILGLGNLGALASKPVMEGKAVLFKKFADIDVYDIELNCSSVQELISTVANMSPTFGGINLEDIKAPECFKVEEALKEKLSIPVFHDDQHGTAIIVAAGLLNALQIQGKSIKETKVVCVGAGAAGIASMKLLRELGFNKDNLIMIDRNGVIHDDRDDLNEYKAKFAIATSKRTLSDALKDADVFIGVSGPDLLNEESLKLLAPNPIIFALSNPDPEVKPELVAQVRPDAIMATGRSDYPNQVNNVLCFPFIFRGALDARATKINLEMQLAAVNAIKDLAQEEITTEVRAAYAYGDTLEFGPNYFIPTPFDSRLKQRVSAAVAKAAVESGVTIEVDGEL